MDDSLVGWKDAGVAVSQQSLIYIFRDGPSPNAQDAPRQVLLGEKLRGFGRGKIVGPGGHVEAGETDAEAAIRELNEETGVIAEPDSVDRVATMRFRFPYDPASDADVGVFLVSSWSGTEQDSDELTLQWYDVDAIPLDRMWDDDRYWLPRVLAGERLVADFSYDRSGVLVVDHDIRPLSRP